MTHGITFRHTPPSEAIKEHIIGKLQKLEKYLIKPNGVHVILTVDKSRHTAEFLLSENGHQFTAKEEGHDMYLSVDGALHRLEHQLKKYKEKVKDHKKTPLL
ncbi:MAG: ribosome-associated translation inhibitor RaiA [bacterium]|nr:ribosome-associated translation inhibitor RaiA [bacterium]